MSASPDERDAVADTLIDAVSRYDGAALRSLCADEFVHWLNLTGQEQGPDALAALLDAERQVVAGASVTERRRTATDDGVVLQLTVEGTTRGGAAFRVPVCLVVAMGGGRVVRLDEYASSDHVKPLVRELSGTAG